MTYLVSGLNEPYFVVGYVTNIWLTPFNFSHGFCLIPKYYARARYIPSYFQFANGSLYIYKHKLFTALYVDYYDLDYFKIMVCLGIYFILEAYPITQIPFLRFRKKCFANRGKICLKF